MKQSQRESLNKISIHTALIIGSAIMVIPFLWMLATSFKTIGESMQIPPTILPKDMVTGNYSKVVELLPFVKFYVNTFVMIVVRVLTSSLFSAMAAYAFARIVFPGRNFLFMFVLIQMMVPGQIFIIPQYLMVQKLGWLNSIPALIFPGLVSAFGTFLLRQFFMGIPKSLEEAATIDGANKWQIFWYIMLPLAKPGLISLSIFTALFAWKDLMWPLIVNMDLGKMTLSAGLASLVGQFTTDYPVLMAGSVIAIIPMVIVFVVFQKQFISGIALTGGK